jgi:ParB family chromosome partitioning protein
MALIENIQRADLNPIEEARAYKLLIDRFKLKQQDVAKRVGKERTTITNSLRLLNLPEDIQTGLIDKKITQGHAKVLLSIEDNRKLMNVYYQVVEMESQYAHWNPCLTEQKKLFLQITEAHREQSSLKAPR